MPQKLSAMKYIINNKRRVSVLIVSMTLCFLLFYLSQFLLSVTTESFRDLLIHNAEKGEYAYLPLESLEPDSKVWDIQSDDDYFDMLCQKNQELIEKLKKEPRIQDAFYADLFYVELNAVVGQYYTECPMLTADALPIFLKHYGAELCEGRMPEQDNEILLDRKFMKNSGYQLGDSLRGYSKATIVGVLKSDYYVACGLYDREEAPSYNPQLVILTTEPVTDLAVLLRDIGYVFDDGDAHIVDIKTGEANLQKDVIDAIDRSTDIIYAGIVIVMSLTILIVYITYLRDRRNEWCLYCSIGFSRKSIYFSVMRELLFTFGAALVFGGLLACLSMAVLSHTMVDSLGLKCRYFYPDTLFGILCIFLLILGVLQFPIRIALYKIRTIDAMDDDLI